MISIRFTWKWSSLVCFFFIFVFMFPLSSLARYVLSSVCIHVFSHIFLSPPVRHFNFPLFHFYSARCVCFCLYGLSVYQPYRLHFGMCWWETVFIMQKVQWTRDEMFIWIWTDLFGFHGRNDLNIFNMAGSRHRETLLKVFQSFPNIFKKYPKFSEIKRGFPSQKFPNFLNFPEKHKLFKHFSKLLGILLTFL